MLKYLKAKTSTLGEMVRRKKLSIFTDKAFWGKVLNQVNKNVVYRFAWPFFVKDVKAAKAKSLEGAADFSFKGCLGLVSPLQFRTEIIRLITIVQQAKPKTVVEIGTCNGGTLFLLSYAASPDAKIISIDLPYGKFGGGYPKWAGKLYENFATGKQSISLIREDSHKVETLEKLKAIIGNGKIDVLFIDGDHTYEGVKRDFNLYGGLVRKGGIIALHDVAVHTDEKCNVNLFWDELKKERKTVEIIEDPKQGWGGIGVVFV
jgi:predicted O-methyltransferase YrrM